MTRVITALVLAITMGVLLFLGAFFTWQLLFLLVVFVIGFEWAGFAKVKKLIDKLLWGVAFLLSVLLLDYLFSKIIFFDILFLVPLVLMVVLVALFQKNKGADLLTNPVYLFALGIVIIYPFYHSIILFKADFSPKIILLSFFIIWAIDVGAYFIGKQFGKTKLASYVSPGKSWEGVFGGVVFSVIVAYLGLMLVEPKVNVSYFILALILSLIATLSVFGDLFESVLKRQVNLKDSSRLLPGHGGVLDRLDSIVLAIPLYFVVWKMVSV